jgi:hypothetical protein
LLSARRADPEPEQLLHRVLHCQMLDLAPAIKRVAGNDCDNSARARRHRSGRQRAASATRAAPEKGLCPDRGPLGRVLALEVLDQPEGQHDRCTAEHNPAQHAADQRTLCVGKPCPQ